MGELLLFLLCVLKYSPQFSQDEELQIVLMALVENKDVHITHTAGFLDCKLKPYNNHLMPETLPFLVFTSRLVTY